MTGSSKNLMFDGSLLTKFTIATFLICMPFDIIYAFLLPMVTALPLEFIALLATAYLLGFWNRRYRWTMRTAVVLLSAVVPNIAMGVLVTALMILQILKGTA